MESTIVHQFPLLFVILVGMAGLFIAVLLLQLRRRRSRLTRRSPLTSDLLRGPGHQLREQIDEIRDKVDESLTMLVFGPMLVYAIHLSQSYILGAAESPLRIAVSAAAIFGFIVFYTRNLLKLSRRHDHLRLGLDAEIAVGQELDQLMREGAVVFHDLPADKFNIDHVVICPSGVYSVETKGRAKPIKEGGTKDATMYFDGKALKFPAWTETEPIKQAERQATWLKRWLTSAVGESVSVRPVLALPGWFIERQARPSVFIFNGKKPQFLLTLRPEGDLLSKQDIQRIAHQVEQRCRSVQPLFNRSGNSSTPATAP